MSAPTVVSPGKSALSMSIVGNVSGILRFRESWRGSGMKSPRSCNLRRTKPVGPMALCSDLDCYSKCVDLTSHEMERERVELTRYEILKEAEVVHD